MVLQAPVLCMKNLAFLLLGVLYCFSTKASCPDFQFVCPGDITIRCDQDYSDLDQFGKAYTICHGEQKWIHVCKVIYDVNSCGEGTIKRYWQAEDTSWQLVTCYQTITVTSLGAFSYADITWPLNIEIESCDPAKELTNLRKHYDRPYWRQVACSQPMYNYKDEKFVISPTCIKIVREWKILDWCTYDPGKFPGRGIFTNKQVIKLITVDPNSRLICPKDTIIYADKDCKGAFVKMDSSYTINSCGVLVPIYNTSKYADKPGSNASGFYPIGSYKFYYVAEVGCDHEIKCEITVNVRPAIPPTPYCLDGVVIALMPIDNNLDGQADEGMVEVWASDLDKGSYHSCGNIPLTFSFSKYINDRSRVFTCDDLGVNEVEIWVTDTAGNQNLCHTHIDIQNNTQIPNCEPDSLIAHQMDWFLLTNKSFEGSLMLREEGGSQTTYAETSQLKSKFNHVKSRTTYVLSTDDLHKLDESSIDHNDYMVLRNILLGKKLFSGLEEKLKSDINSDGIIDRKDLQLLSTFLNSAKNNQIHLPIKILPLTYLDPSGTAWNLSDIHTSFRIDNLERYNNAEFVLLQTGDLSSNSAVQAEKFEESDGTELIENLVRNNLNLKDFGSLNFTANHILDCEIYNLQGQCIFHSGNQINTLGITGSQLIIYRIHLDSGETKSGKYFYTR